MLRKFLASLIALYSGCALIGYNVETWIGFAIAFIGTAFFCIGWEIVLQLNKTTEQESSVNVKD